MGLRPIEGGSMYRSLIPFFKRAKSWQILLLSVGISEVVGTIVVASISIMQTGRIERNYVVTSLIVGLLTAGLVTSFVLLLVDEIRRSEAELDRRAKSLEKANRELGEANRVKGEFVSNVSHELRTPITSIKMHLELLAGYPNKVATYLATLYRETGRLERIIEDLLLLSRLDQGEVEMELTTIDCNTLAGQHVADRQLLTKNNSLTLTFAGHPDQPLTRGDKGLLDQALSILLTNALNYTPPGGQVAVSTLLREMAGQRWVGLSVSDTGPGIPFNERDQLFERFVRGKVGYESGVPGTGLGLAIAHEIMARHGGLVEVISEGVPGKGATFSLWLPAKG